MDDDLQVDFIIGEDDLDAGEDLPGGFDRTPNRRLRVGLTVLAAALAIGVLIVRVSSSKDSPPSAQATPSVPVTASIPAPIEVPPGVILAPAPYVKKCPLDERSRSLCTNANALPRDVVAALRNQFPTARIRSSTEEELRDIGFGSGMLYYRELHARVGVGTLDVEVHPLVDGDIPLVLTGASSITVQILTPGDTVRVTVTAPPGQLPAIRIIRALASDGRLVVDG